MYSQVDNFQQPQVRKMPTVVDLLTKPSNFQHFSGRRFPGGDLRRRRMRTNSSSSSSCSPPSSGWTAEENKRFEAALAVFDPEKRATPEVWERIAARVPGKTAEEVRRHYDSLVEDVRRIDDGGVPVPTYVRGYVQEEDEGELGFRVFQREREVLCCGRVGVGGVSGCLEQERKKGVPWTAEEHRLFLMGLKKYGKGDWRSISRNFVISRTPTQVASHAQKYFIRHNSGKERRRPSIHDITSINDPAAHVDSYSETTECSPLKQLDMDSTVPQIASSPINSSPESKLTTSVPSITPSHSLPGLYMYHGWPENHPSNSFRNSSSCFGS